MKCEGNGLLELLQFLGKREVALWRHALARHCADCFLVVECDVCLVLVVDATRTCPARSRKSLILKRKERLAAPPLSRRNFASPPPHFASNPSGLKTNIVCCFGPWFTEPCRFGALVDTSVSHRTTNSVPMDVTPGYLTPTSRLNCLECCRLEDARGVDAFSFSPAQI